MPVDATVSFFQTSSFNPWVTTSVALGRHIEMCPPWPARALQPACWPHVAGCSLLVSSDLIFHAGHYSQGEKGGGLAHRTRNYFKESLLPWEPVVKCFSAREVSRVGPSSFACLSPSFAIRTMNDWRGGWGRKHSSVRNSPRK